tara:strand:+ start:660 stop:785 length:126 start_codon:yes stop_codon:yes gene_type:complete
MGAKDEYNSFLDLGTLKLIKWYEIEAEIIMVNENVTERIKL